MVLLGKHVYKAYRRCIRRFDGPSTVKMASNNAPTPSRVSLELFAQFLQSYIPVKTSDVPFLYHVPRLPYFDVATASVRKAIFSITATKGVYEALNSQPTGRCASRFDNTGVIVAFLHRPWSLDRYQVPRRAGVVLSSHKSFDEVLTVGWNVQLAFRLGINLQESLCIQGYKNDPERRIGLVGTIDTTEKAICDAISREFEDWEGKFGFSNDLVAEDASQDTSQGDRPIRVVAIMNAFHSEEVERVADAALQAGYIKDLTACDQILYLTGAVRQPGVEAALERGMRVICVGHKVCEVWGMKFLAAQIRSQFPGLEVVEIDEPEETPPTRQTSLEAPSVIG